MNANKALQCPHCGAELDAFEMPEGSGWDGQVHWACFNDECPYYKDGWVHMWDNYQIHASYRHRIISPETGKTSPLSVWSEDAIRDRIIRRD